MFQYHAIFNDYWIVPHKVTFNGIAKTITINYGQSIIRVKEDIYSDWKEWMLIQDNSKFAPALRSIGGDPIDVANGISAGDIYFLINGWKIIIPHSTQIIGTLYSEDGTTPYIIEARAGVSATVSNLVQSVTTNVGGSSGPTVQQIQSGVRSELSPELYKIQSIQNAPTSTQVADAVRTNLTTDLAHLNSLQNTVVPSIPTPLQVAQAVRTELGPELTHITSQTNGLTTGQANMLLEMYRLMGLDPTKPLVVTATSVDAGPEIHQVISGDNNSTTATRVI